MQSGSGPREARDGPTWLAAERAAAARDIAHYEQQIAEELEQNAKRNRYIEAFLSSLPPQEGRDA